MRAGDGFSKTFFTSVSHHQRSRGLGECAPTFSYANAAFGLIALWVSRSGVYRPKAAHGDDDLALMRRIDELFLAHPFLGSRRIALMLGEDGCAFNRKRIQRLMRRMGIAALGPKPRTSKPATGHKIYPYLLRGLRIDRPNQVWAADITYIPIGRGFLYLVAIMDWASRAALAHQRDQIGRRMAGGEVARAALARRPT
jgi:transposase InsO family protein